MRMKVYPWKGLVREIKGKYGLFPDIENLGSLGWDIQNTYGTPTELAEEFNKFLSKLNSAIEISSQYVLPKQGKQRHVIRFFKYGRITGLTEEEFESFRKVLKKEHIPFPTTD